MRILLDEQLAVDLRHDFGEGFEVETAEYRGWKGVKNGALLRKAEAALREMHPGEVRHVGLE